MIIPNDIDFAEYIQFLGGQESQSIEWVSHWGDELEEHLVNPKSVEGTLLPWSKVADNVRLRSGEISIWAGMNGHRKSMLTSMVALWASAGERVCIASLEMKPVETLARMVRQVAGCKDVNPAYARKFVQWADERICIYDQLDSVESERILGMIYYCARELKCRHIFIDSLTKCGLASGDAEAEKKFIDRLQWASKTLGCHIHLICHVRKPQSQGEEHRPTKFDIRGAGELTDLVDNVFIVWRNKAKEKSLETKTKGFSLSERDLNNLEQPDQFLTVCKQRHGAWEGEIALWFDNDSLQFTGDGSGRTLPFELDVIF